MKMNRFRVMQYLSALVRQGIDQAQLIDVPKAFEPSLIQTGFMFFYERAGNQYSAQMIGIAAAVLDLAKSWCKSSHVKAIKVTLSDIPANQGMSSKVRKRLNQLDDSRNQEALLMLPDLLRQEADRIFFDSPIEAAHRHEEALAMEYFFETFIRVGQLVIIDINRHFKHGNHPDSPITLEFSAEEVKSRDEQEFGISDELYNLTQIHISKFRRYLPGSESRWLFPHSSGGHQSGNSFGTRMSRIIYTRTNVDMTPHMYRHFGSDSYLEENPRRTQHCLTGLGSSLRSIAGPLCEAEDVEVGCNHGGVNP